MSTETALELSGVGIRYAGAAAPVLDGCSFRLAPGERAALLGLNGSGKTSLLSAIVGLVPFTGAIAVEGLAVGPRSLSQIRSRIGFLFGSPDDQILFPNVLEDVAFSLRRSGLSAEERLARARGMLAKFGIARLAGAEPYVLSQGERQRVALAGCLAGDPGLLLLDEPSASLDPVGKVALARLLAAEPAAMLVATHDLDFARRLCTRFILLGEGKVLSDSPDVKAAERYFQELQK